MDTRKIYMLGVLVLSVIVVGGYKFLFDQADHDEPVAFDKYNSNITIAVEQNYRPFSYIDENGNHVGFDYDIALNICKELKLTCTIQEMPFPQITEALKVDKVQMAVSGLSITDDRKKYLAFSDPYYHSLTHFISNNPNIGTMRFADPEFRSLVKIGVQENSMQYEFARDKMFDHSENILLYSGYEALAQALLSKQVDVVLLDGFAAFDLLNRDPSVYSVGSVEHITDNTNEIDTMRIAVALKNAKEIEYINYALSQLRQRGAYQKIAAKYFPFLSEQGALQKYFGVIQVKLFFNGSRILEQ